MKCAACGYEDEVREFGKIDGTNGYTFALRTSKDNYSSYSEVHMYVCPVCNTVRIEK
jgi:hypothetical protein